MTSLKQYSFFICGVIYLIFLIYILFNKLFKDISVQYLANDPKPFINSVKNHPALFLGSMGMIWTIIGLFTPLWFLFGLLLLSRLVYLFSPLNREHDLLQYKINTAIEIIIVTIILIVLFYE